MRARAGVPHRLKKRGMRTPSARALGAVLPKLEAPPCWRGSEMWGFMAEVGSGRRTAGPARELAGGAHPAQLAAAARHSSEMTRDELGGVQGRDGGWAGDDGAWREGQVATRDKLSLGAVRLCGPRNGR